MGDTPFPLSVTPNLHVLPGGPDLISHVIQTLQDEELADAVEGLDYDALVFDCPPGNEHLERLGLVAAQTALIVADAHPLALLGAGRVLGELESSRSKGRRGASKWAIVQSRIDLRRSLDRDLETELQRTYPNIERLLVRQDTNLSLAAADRVPIMLYSPECRGAKDLLDIARWAISG